MSIDDLQYQAWVKDRYANRCVLCVAEHADGVEYASNQAYRSQADDSPAYQPFQSLLLKIPEITDHIDAPAAYSELVFANNGRLNDWITKKWRGYELNIQWGDPNWPLSDFRPLLKGINAGINVPDNRISFKLYDIMEKLNVPLQTHKWDDGEEKWLTLGEPFYVPFKLIDDVNHIWQAHDGPCSIPALKDGAVDITAYTDHGDGRITLDTPAISAIGGVVLQADNTAAKIIQYCCDRVGFSDIDSANFAAFPNTAKLGIQITGNRTALSVISEVLDTVGAIMRPNHLNQLQLIRKEDIATPRQIFTPHMSKTKGVKLVKTIEPKSTISLNYKKRWLVHNKDALDVNISEAEKDIYSKEWDTVSTDNNLSGYPLAKPADVKNTLFVIAADTQAESDRLAQLQAKERYIYEVTLLWHAFTLNVNQTIQVNYMNGSELSALTGKIHEIRKQISKNQATVLLWL